MRSATACWLALPLPVSARAKNRRLLPLGPPAASLGHGRRTVPQPPPRAEGSGQRRGGEGAARHQQGPTADPALPEGGHVHAGSHASTP